MTVSSNSDQTIEYKKTADKSDVKIIRQYLKKSGKPVSLEMIRMNTGLATHIIDQALNELIKQFYCTADFDDDNVLFYSFDLSKKRNQTGLREVILNIPSFFLKLVVFLFKFTFTAIFFLFASTFGLILSLIGVLLLKSPQPLILLAVGLWEGLKLLFYNIKGVFTGRQDEYRSAKRGMVEIILAYGFGESRVRDSLEMEKRILRYLRNNRYKITLAEILLITGWPVEKCKQEITYLLANFDGDLYVTDTGTVIYDFGNLKTDEDFPASANTDSYIWNNPEKTGAWNLNTYKTNRAVSTITCVIIIGCLLFIGFFVVVAELDLRPVLALVTANPIELFTGNPDMFFFYIPVMLLYFFCFFLLLSFISRFKNQLVNRGINKRNNDRLHLKYIYDNLPVVDSAQLKSEKINEFRKLFGDYWGETEFDSSGNIKYNFELLAAELMAVKAERSS
ncbi:MAG: hypothetical protein JW969_04590 [Spirochaetales bacterium]|nr:hypothetical protein [Spirochaetales bacterium]